MTERNGNEVTVRCDEDRAILLSFQNGSYGVVTCKCRKCKAFFAVSLPSGALRKIN